MSSYKTTNYDMNKWAGTDSLNRTEFNNNFDIIDSQLAQNENGKISIGAVDIQRDLNKNISKIDQTMLTDELLQQIAGSTPINAVPADNSLVTKQYVNKSITTNKINDVEFSTETPSNSIDINEYELQEGFSYSSTGAKTANANFTAIVFIVKQDGKLYTPSVYRLQKYSGYPSETTYIEKIGGIDNAGSQIFDVVTGQYITLSVQLSVTPNVSDVLNSIKKNYKYNMQNININNDNLYSVFGNVNNPQYNVTIDIVSKSTQKNGYYANENGWNANATYTSYDYEIDETLNVNSYNLNYSGGTLFSVSVYSGVVCKNNFIQRYLLSEVSIDDISPSLLIGYHIVFSYGNNTNAEILTIKRPTLKYFYMPYLLTNVNYITKIDSDNYIINIGNYTLNLVKRTLNGYTRWNILGINYKNTEIVTPETDILGPIRESNNTWLGGVHGREQVDNFAIIIDGRYFSNDADNICIFKSLNIIQESTIHSSIDETSCLTRFLRLTFNDNRLSVENHYKSISAAGFTTSRAANGGVLGSPNTVVAAIALTNKFYFAPPVVSGTVSETIAYVNNATYFYTTGNSITIKNITGSNYENYSGLFVVYGDETPVRSKIYFNTVEGTSVTIALNEILLGKFEYTFN